MVHDLLLRKLLSFSYNPCYKVGQVKIIRISAIMSGMIFNQSKMLALSLTKVLLLHSTN